MPHLIPKHQLGNIILPHKVVTMFDDNSIINYLNKFLMFTGAAGMANKKASPK